MRRTRHTKGEDGFTLVEVLMAIIVILIAVLGTVALMDKASANTGEAKMRQTATALVRDLLETSQGLAYSTVTPATIVSTLQSKGFADDSATTTGWQINRNGVTFTVTTASVCSVDDSSDGSGVHAAGTSFCSDSPAGTADGQPDDYKRVTFTVTPPAGTGPAVTETTIVGQNRASGSGGGGGGGSGSGQLSVTNLQIDTSSGKTTLYNGQVAPCLAMNKCVFPSATSSTVTPKNVWFIATTGSQAQKVKFAVNGKVMATVSGPGTSFSWNWTPIPDNQPDGVYTVTAQVFDTAGTTALSDPKPLSVTLNRYRPDWNAYTAASAGRNPLWGTPIVATCPNATLTTCKPEIELYPSSSATARVDRDVTGFEFWRYIGKNGSGVQFCVTTGVAARWCQDTSNPTNSGVIQYAVAADAKNPDGTSQWSDITGKSVDINLSNGAPNPPTGLSVSRSGTTVTLSWTNPSASGDPNSGDCVDFYRVYRKNAGDASAWTVNDRVDRTPFGNAVSPCGAAGEVSNSITLFEADANAKQYKVTSVDTHLAESTTMLSGSG
jgi:prepilin-type N-terminal cleavage/methylation domain-containing protein